MPGLRRLYSPHLAAAEAGSEIELDGDEAHYALRVLRLEMPDEVELFDGEGHRAQGEITAAGKRDLRVRVGKLRREPAPAAPVDVAVPLPKGPRAQDMIDSLSQIGVNRLILLNTERSTVEPREAKFERFVQSTIESARQCGRAWRMKIDPPRDLPEVLKSEKHAVRLMADPAGEEGGAAAAGASVLVLIGPEGGWTDQERSAGESAGFRRWSFNPNVLRIETAAPVAAAILMHVARPVV